MYDDTIYDNYRPFAMPPRERLHEGGRLSHLVFVDGRLVDAWSQPVHESEYESIASAYDQAQRPKVLQSPAPAPRHRQVLEWLDGVLGSRAATLALTADPHPVAPLGAIDPVDDEPWLIVNELLVDTIESVMSQDLLAPARECLLLLRQDAGYLIDRTSPARIAGAILWVLGKANALFGPRQLVTQKEIAEHLGLSSLSGCQQLAGALIRLRFEASAPGQLGCPDLLATGRPELLTARVRADLVRLRDDALTASKAELKPQGTPARSTP